MHELLYICSNSAGSLWVCFYNHQREFKLTLNRRENPDSLIPYLLAGAEDEKGLCFDFLGELVNRFGEDEDAKSIIVNAVTGMSSQLSMMSMNDDYLKYTQV